jgi:AraC-like DNA-binding protein
MVQRLSVSVFGLDGFEGLHEGVKGSHIDVMQLGRGRLRGTLSHVGIGDFSLSIGSFNLGLRAQRISTDDKLIVGMLLNADDRVTHWSFDMRPADVLVIPPLIEHDGIFHGASSYAAIRFDLAELASLFGGDARLSDPANWLQKNYHRADPAIGMAAARRLPQIVAHLAQQRAVLSDGTAEFWKRSIVDCLTGTIANSLPHDDSGHLPSALSVVRRVEDYLAAAGPRPVHISEICAGLNLSRRGLHRAFHEVFGIGPVTFLRYKRLCAVHSILRERAPGTVTVSEVAMQQGFIELGRFAHYYKTLFGEYPSDTLGGRRFRGLWPSVARGSSGAVV